MTATDVIARYRKYGWSEQAGEWGYIQAETRASFRDLLEAGDEESVKRVLDTMFQQPVMLGLQSFDFRDIDERKKDVLLKALQANMWLWVGSDLNLLAAPDVGAPQLLQVDGVAMLYDAPRHDNYAQGIGWLLATGGVVLEIGGGYGGTALQLLRRTRDIRVVICDLPETLYLSGYFLSHALPDRTVAWWDEDPHADVVLLPAQELEHLKHADLVFAAHSLCEMGTETAGRYMAWIEQHRPLYFYHDSAVEPPADSGSTAAQFPELMASDLVPQGYMRVGQRRLAWPGTGGRYSEFLYEARQ